MKLFEKIEGYSGMTAEEKLSALESLEYEDRNEEVSKLKTAMSKANSENAEQKRRIAELTEKWKAEMDEAKRAQVEREERDRAVEEELRTLRRDKTVAGYVNSCLALGYDKDLAIRAAEAMADGNAAEIMNCQQEFLAVKQKELEANALNKQPSLSVGATPTAKQAESEAQNKLRGYFGLPPLK